MKFSELRNILEKAGCYIKRHGSDHDLYYSPKTGKIFPVGRHQSKEVPKGTLKSIFKQAGIK
ncbi:MAG: type II toxin-antitoxin system HicA family toxin [Draconibacterium sp.]|nr:type II toxin-antitoxin system HicA family toxin [Draconibacterium sp.]